MRRSSSRHPRDSDASFASGSSAGYAINTQPLKVTDPAYKQAAIRYLNAYFATHNFSITLSLKQLPTGPVINSIFRFLFSRLQFTSSSKVEDDLPILLKGLNCPHKFGKSNIRALGTPHAFPNTLAVMYWLAQLASYTDHHLSVNSSPSGEDDGEYDPITSLSLKTYSHFMRGDDDTAEELKQDFVAKLQQENEGIRKEIESLKVQIPHLESKLQSLKTEPSPLEKLEEQKLVMEKDVDKFTDYIARLKEGIKKTDKELQVLEKELEAKVVENVRICELNEELKKKIEAQGIHSRGAEMMKRELKALDRDIDDADSTRRLWDDKCWDLDSKMGIISNEMKKLSVECNQALRRLKLGSGFQYALNLQGSTVADVLGIDYKSTIKPAIKSLADEIKQNSTKHSEELVGLQQQAVEISARIKAKTTHINELEQRIAESKSRLNCLKKEVEDCEAKCNAEAKRMVEDLETDAHNLKIRDAQAKETLKAAEMKLLEAKKQSEDEIQKCAHELFALIDSISKHKEHTELKISEMSKQLFETVGSSTDVQKRILSDQFSISLDGVAMSSAGKRRRDDK